MTTIKRAERLLTAVGYTPGTVDGQQTPELQAAVMQFQDAWGLPATGTLDEKTLDRLEFSAMRKRTMGDDGFIGIGRKSEDAKRVESQLRRLGYDVGKVDGVYSRDTAAAMKAFRADQPELGDGLPFATAKAQSELQAEVDAFKHAPWRRRVAASPARTAADQATKLAAANGIDATDSASTIANVQRHLRAAGYDPQQFKGVLDSRTTGAIRAFQKQSGLTVTGNVDAATWKKLQASQFQATSGTSPAQSLLERSTAVLQSEKLLAKAGFKTGKVDGLFTKNTAAAVRAFEKRAHLTVDGKISARDLAKLKTWSTPKTAPEPPNDYRRVQWTGQTINVRTKVMLERAEQYLKDMGVTHHFSLSQGSYHQGVGASAGTHDGGGAVDIRVNGKSWATQQKMVKALRMAGFAAWARTSGDGFAPHIHAIAIGDKQTTAGYQVDAYFAGRNGLKNNAVDRNAAVGRPYPDWAKKYR